MDGFCSPVHVGLGCGVSFAVQRLRLSEDGPVSYTVVGDDGLPVDDLEDFLAYLTARGASPNTVQGYAYDLRDFFVWLGQTGLDFRHLRLEVVAQFFDWLRRPKPARAPRVFVLPGVGQALENTTLQRKRAALASFYRFHARRDERVPMLLGNLLARRPTGSYTPMLAHTQRGGEVEYSPIRIHAHRKPPRTLTDDELQRLMSACNRRRDRFLIALLDDSGSRFFITTGDFLDQHRRQREETRKLIGDAEQASLSRIVEKNTRTLGKLDTIIDALEQAGPQQIVAGGKVTDLDATG